MILGLRTAIYPVADLAAATAWYSALLQCDPTFEAAFYVGFSVGGYELGLVPDGTPGNAGATVYWGTADIDAEVTRVLGLGADLDTPVADVGDGIRLACVRDPDGNVFGLIENPHFHPVKVG